MRMVRTLFLIALISAVAASCRKPDSVPPEPQIEYVDFKQVQGDSAWLIINFQDGDGDLGAEEGDTTASLFLKYVEVKNGNATEIPLSIPIQYAMPDITPEGKNKSISGQIWILLPFYYDPASDFDAIRFRVKLVDRAGNESNELETPDIIVEP